MNPFPTPYATLLGDLPALDSALQTAITEVQAATAGLEALSNAPISIAAVDGTAGQLDVSHGGARFGETHYSASLLKVAAMYAAFELLAAASRVASSAGSAADLYARLHAAYDDEIDNATAPTIAATPGLTKLQRLPRYEQIIAAPPLAGGGVRCSFQDGFANEMLAMMLKSSNDSAATCISALGYSWIYGTLTAGGFFFAPTSSGVWLAGTFTGALPAARIPSINDGPVAQAATTFDLANMVAHMRNGTLVDAESSNHMLDILAATATGGVDPSWMDFTRRPGYPARSFSVTHTKIGLGPLKGGAEVASEGSIVEHSDTGRQFIVVWQNCPHDHDTIVGMGAVVERTIERFLMP